MPAMSNHPRHPAQSPRDFRLLENRELVPHRALVVHGIDEALACVADLKASVAAGGVVSASELSALAVRLSTARSMLSSESREG